MVADDVYYARIFAGLATVIFLGDLRVQKPPANRPLSCVPFSDEGPQHRYPIEQGQRWMFHWRDCFSIQGNRLPSHTVPMFLELLVQHAQAVKRH